MKIYPERSRDAIARASAQRLNLDLVGRLTAFMKSSIPTWAVRLSR